jgi:ribonuclease P protein component
MGGMTAAPQPRFRFGARDRLHGQRAFARVFQARAGQRLGLVTVWAVPNDVGRPRLGLSIGRRVGNAVQRVKIKRLLREAFRLGRDAWPAGYDVVVVAAPHQAAALAEYQSLLAQAAGALHREWQRRRKRAEGMERGRDPS